MINTFDVLHPLHLLKMKKTILFLISIITLLTGSIVSAQTYHVIDGVVIDEKGETLPYVSLRITGRAGTMTNADGGFVFKYKQTVDKDSLLVSYIGYKNLSIPFSALHTSMKIRLEPAAVNLKEVVITGISAESIIRQAIKDIPKNYDTSPFEMKGFYRESGKVDTNYLSFAEASLHILNPGYTTDKRDLIVINKERNLKKIGEKEVNNPLHLSVDGAPYTILLSDIIKNPAHTLGKDYAEKYKFEIAGSTEIYGEDAWLIQFDQRDGVKQALYKGTMVIIKSSFAIVSIDFALSPKGIEYAKADISFLARPVFSLLGYSIKKLNEEFSERYIKIDGKWYPYFYKIVTAHHFKARYQHLEGNLYINAEMFISKVNKIPELKYDSRLIMPRNYVFKNYVTEYKDDYWGDYNFIKPTNSLREITEKISPE